MTQIDHWNPALYDNSHAFISKFGADVIEVLNPKKGEVILDLGCGTGDLAQELVERGVIVTGIDQSKNMIQQAQAKYPTINFHVADANKLTYTEEFDAIFSNAALHWIKTAEDVIQSVYKALKPGGRFVAEFGGYGNVVPFLNAILKQAEAHGERIPETNIPWYFPSIGEYTSLLEKQGFLVTYATLFDRPTPLFGADGLKKWLTMFASDFFRGIDSEKTAQIIHSIEAELMPTLFDGTDWIAPYKRIRICCLKS